jgi:hypothetical protein
VQISDGAVQTSGVAVKVIPFGQSEASGSGTVAYSADGVVLYTPTQAETNYTSFVLVASKSGCIPATVTVVTSAAGIASIADAVWDEAYSGHTTAGTFGKLMDILRKANAVVEGTVLASPAPTTTTFSVSGLNYPTGAFRHSVLWFADDATLAEQNSPILTYTNNGDGTSTIVLEEPLTAAPIAGDTILIDPTSHVHSVAAIQAGLGTIDNQRYLLSILAGATSNAGTTGETYAITISGSTYTVTYAGLDATGNRGATAFAKT